jgi:phosphoribosyl-ATP pyrophosphohydrolase/phosphoribosyl-AMP cyclohydrolase
VVACAKPFVQGLEAVLSERKHSHSGKSYTKSLFDGGPAKIGEKVHEEAGEFVDALTRETDERVASEAADVVFHLLVGLRLRNIPFRSVLQVLAGRFGVGGHVEKAARS